MKTNFYPLRVSLLAAALYVPACVSAQTGNVGIGTTTPQSQLHTTGSVQHDTLAGIGQRLVYADSAGRLFPSLPSPGGFQSSMMTVPDNGCSTGSGITSNITVSGQPTSVSSAIIRVRVVILTTYASDVEAYLVSPTNDTLRLISNNGGSGDNFWNTVFTDSAASALPSSNYGAPFTGLYRPTAGLAARCGITPNVSTFGAIGGGNINPNGVWRLLVFDDFQADKVTLHNWGITFDGDSPPPAESYPLFNNVVPKASGGQFVGGSMFDVGGKIGIGVSDPNAELQLSNAHANRKIVLWQNSNNDHRFVGLGLNSAQFRYQVADASNHHIFYAANSDSTSQELMRVTGTGRVGIGVPNPTQALDVRGNIRMTDGSPNMLSSSNSLMLRADDDGSGSEEMSFAIGFSERMRITAAGRLGIGTSSPQQMLDVVGGVKASKFIGAGDSLTGLVNTTTAQNVNGVKTFASNVIANAAVGIGTAAPNAPLQFASTLSNRKIVLYETANNDHRFLGFGINQNALRYQTAVPTDDHVFMVGTSDTTSRELMRIRGNGNVSIGGLSSSERLVVDGSIRMLGANQHSLSSWGSLDLHANDDSVGIEMIRFLVAKTERMRISHEGFVGIGTAAPNAPLQFANTLSARKLVLYETLNNDHNFLGFGISPGILRYQVANPGNDHVFYAGNTSTASTELLRVAGSGEVTMNGMLTAGGVKLPTNGGTPAPLDHYEEATAIVQFSNGGTVYQTGYTVKLLRIGKQVTLTFPADAIAMNVTAHDIIVSILDARFRPASNVFVPLRVTNASVPEIGVAWIRTDGHVYIRRGSGVAFGGANSGIYAGAITYSLQ